MKCIAPLLTLFLLCSGCWAPSARLSFPYRRLVASTQPQWFDVGGNHRNDFAITFGARGNVDSLWYDDNGKGVPTRAYRLSDYAQRDVPHVIILLDSVPFQCVAERYAAGEFRWFSPPRKVIPPFPSLTELSYTELLHAPPMPGMTDRSYDRRTGRRRNGLWERLTGYKYPWEKCLWYGESFYESGLSYLNPKPWYQAELERARHAVDESQTRTTVVYLESASAMICKYGRDGIDEVLDGAARLCLQLLYERQGALKISLMADHGHNMVRSKNIDVAEMLQKAGFNPSNRMQSPNDVVLELNGLVTCTTARTMRPADVANCLLTHPGIDTAFYPDGDHIVIRNLHGQATIERRGNRYRYRASTFDVLEYRRIIETLQIDHKLDQDGFIASDDWFTATADAAYPDGPARVWQAFHGLVVDPPELIFTTRDGFCAGDPAFEHYIDMLSSHGSLNQINSATFLLEMSDDHTGPLRMRDVLPTIAPGFEPAGRLQP